MQDRGQSPSEWELKKAGKNAQIWARRRFSGRLPGVRAGQCLFVSRNSSKSGSHWNADSQAICKQQMREARRTNDALEFPYHPLRATAPLEIRSIRFARGSQRVTSSDGKQARVSDKLNSSCASLFLRRKCASQFVRDSFREAGKCK